VKIESLKELVLLMSKIDLSETNPAYMMVPILTNSIAGAAVELRTVALQGVPTIIVRGITINP
jgi:hypothetical protein